MLACSSPPNRRTGQAARSDGGGLFVSSHAPPAFATGGDPSGGGVGPVGAGAPGTRFVHVDTGTGGADEMTILLALSATDVVL